MFRRNKKEVHKSTPTREIPVADISGFNPPQLIESFHLGNTDNEMLKNLREEFVKTGLIDNNKAFDESVQNSDDFLSILETANKAAKNEKDFHEEFYSEETNSTLSDIEHNQEDFLNPLLDGNDDYGHSTYGYDKVSNSSSFFENDISYTNNVSYTNDDSSDNYAGHRESESLVNVEFPDGRVIKGKKL